MRKMLSMSIAAAALSLSLTASATAQGAGAALTPFAGYLVTGNWYDGPLGSNLSPANAPMLGVQGSLPLMRGVSLVGNLGYASGDLQIGVPILGGVSVGSVNTWMYDAGVELGGLGARRKGIAPFVQGGIGGMTNNITNQLLNTRSSNIAYTAGVGIDVGLTDNFALRVQAKDWISRFNSQDAVGFRAEGNLAHNIALSAGVRFAF